MLNKLKYFFYRAQAVSKEDGPVGVFRKFVLKVKGKFQSFGQKNEAAQRKRTDSQGTVFSVNESIQANFATFPGESLPQRNIQIPTGRSRAREPLLLHGFEKKHDTAVILHLFYVELWEEIAGYLENMAGDFDLFVSIPQGSTFQREEITAKFPRAFVYECPNRGRDIAPFLKIFSEIEPLHYKYICKIHTKKSVHRGDGATWRNELYRELLGSAKTIQKIKDHLDQPQVGIIGPKGNLLSTELFMGENQAMIGELARRLNLPYRGELFDFMAGSMFWFKPEAISPILELCLTDQDFPVETGQVDGTLAHAMERFFSFAALTQGYRIIQTGSFSDKKMRNYQYAFAIKK